MIGADCKPVNVILLLMYIPSAIYRLRCYIIFSFFIFMMKRLLFWVFNKSKKIYLALTTNKKFQPINHDILQIRIFIIVDGNVWSIGNSRDDQQDYQSIKSIVLWHSIQAA